MSEIDVKAAVQEKYGQAALRVRSQAGSCCGASAARGASNPITSDHYDDSETGALPEAAVLASLGCGNPTALARLEPGETVLDLGSGGGIDVLLSARRVGPNGKAYGLDMTDEMLALARENQRKAGVENVEFLKGEIEDIPLPDGCVDVVISNCVINLSGDKDRVLREAFRVRGARSNPERHSAVGRLHRRRARGHRICRKAGNSRIRGDQHRADAGLRRRGRARVLERQGHRCRRTGSASRRKIHERVRAGGETDQSTKVIGSPLREHRQVFGWRPASRL